MTNLDAFLTSGDVSDYQHPRLRSHKVMDIYDGAYRVFYNFYNNGKQITLGFPKSNCSDTSVWLAFDGVEAGRIELAEANRYLDNGMGMMLKSMIPNLSNNLYSGRQRFIAGPVKSSPPAKSRSHSGHCIRCGKGIRHDTDRPLCSSCFNSWAKWGNEDYEESFCHTCGRSWTTSKARPECKNCYYA